MKYNKNIKISPLRIIKSSKENNDANNSYQVIYENGIYQLKNNFKMYDKENKNNKIEVEIIGDLGEIINNLLFRLTREKLNPIEYALLFEEVEEISSLNSSKIITYVGGTNGNISNKKRLLKLPFKIQKDIITNKLTERHGRALLQILDKPEKLSSVYEEIKFKKLKVSETENLINLIIGKKKKNKDLQTNIKKEDLNNKLAVMALNQIEQDLEKSLELINRYYPQLGIEIKEGLKENDYILEIKIKDAK